MEENEEETIFRYFKKFLCAQKTFQFTITNLCASSSQNISQGFIC